MTDSYTRMVNDWCFDLVDDDIAAIWEDIENTPEDTDAEKWRKKLTKIANEHSFSSRFALMRILCGRAGGTAAGFAMVVGGQALWFADISLEHAEALSEDELRQYEAALGELASRQKSTDRAADNALICRAFRDEAGYLKITLPAEMPQDEKAQKALLAQMKKEASQPLSRQEAMRLGHILSFSLGEMSWFLLRVFEFEDGFRYNRSEDLIEAYGFLAHKSWRDVERLKQEFAAARPPRKKGAEAESRPAGWTQAAEDSLPRLVELWAKEEKGSDACFLDWMAKRASRLDLPSRTTRRIYQDLAVYICGILSKNMQSPDTAGLAIMIRDFCEDEEQYAAERMAALYRDGKISPAQCRDVGAAILEANKELFTAAADRAKAWRTVMASGTGRPKLIMAGRPDAKRSRVQDLLQGDADIEKGDMLHLVWFAFCLCWIKNPIEDENDLFNSLADFTETAEYILDKALLPSFYPPHMMEQSMMLSIVGALDEGTGEPADVYARICESLIMPRNRKAKSEQE